LNPTTFDASRAGKEIALIRTEFGAGSSDAALRSRHRNPQGAQGLHFQVLEIFPFTRDARNAGVSSLSFRKNGADGDGGKMIG
jgi:hypothetical protein